MSKINILESRVFNQISAGEVVDNPSSIVKELTENSIDAGADFITVKIEEGGLKSIFIADNGCGMPKEDLYKAILPHATSKIKDISDLETIGTLGFRGEALASICAVSCVKINSKFIESDIANYIIVKGNDLIEEGNSTLNTGTTTTVTNLFYNTPARFKFLKLPKSEEQNITKLVAELIFANHDIGFDYFIDGKQKYFTQGQGLEEGIIAVFGADIATNLIKFSVKEKGYVVSGYCARPSTNAIKNNRNNQIIIVNGRVISDNTLNNVIQNAYREQLMRRTFPTIILDIVLPFELVDVNVHPNKREVRFANQKIVNGLVYSAIVEALQNDAESRKQTVYDNFYNTKPISIDMTANNINHSDTFSNDFVESTNFNATECKVTNGNDEIGKEELSQFQNSAVGSHKKSKVSEDKAFWETISTASNFFEEKLNEYKKNSEIDTDPYLRFSDSDDVFKNYWVNDYSDANKTSCKTIGQVFDTYIIVECEDKLYFIDQHATHERLLYDKLVSEFNKEEIYSQELLFPYSIKIDEEVAKNLSNKLPILNKLGFDIKEENATVTISAIPYIMSENNIPLFMTELSEEAKNISFIADFEIFKDKIAKIACKKAIKGGDKLSNNEIEYVIDYFFSKGIPLQCPHGRPTMIEFSRNELEKLFRRKL